MSPSTPETLPPPLPGDLVGPYKLGDVLGVGGMATVYFADTPDGRRVAVKVLHPGRTDQEEARRFRREFLTLRALRHPAIVQVYEAGRAGAYPWIAMELVAGTDLETVIARWGRRPPGDRIGLVEQIFRDVCAALAYIHNHGLIHRDLKPSNVLVTPDHRAKLTDFGVVKAPFGQFHTQLTAVGSLVGTAAYMSPEQISGDPVDGRSDLYSLGAVLYVMLTGRRPIVADTLAGYLSRHLNETPQDPRELDPRIPAGLARICLRLLAKDPAQRYASADQVLAALDAEEDGARVPIHGREAELETLLTLARELGPGEGQLVVVSGPSGSGRTTLLEEFVELGRAAGSGISMGNGESPDLLDILCDQIPSLGPAGVDGPAARRIAVRTGGRPWTLVIDDIDRLDPAVLDTVTHLTRQQIAIEGDPLMVVVSVARRPGPVGAFCSGASTGLTPRALPLAGLTNGATRNLLRDRGLVGAACAALAHRLAAEGVAWPGAVLEQLGALESAGWLSRDPHGGLQLQRGVEVLRHAELPLPTRHRQREARDLDRLDTVARTVLDTLVVIGGESDPATLAEIDELDAHVVEKAALRLARARFVVQEVVGLHPVLRLHPDRSTHLLYDTIEEANRAALHRRVAHALRRQRGRAPIDEIANHLLRGGAAGEAWPLLVRAAAVALRAARDDRARLLLEDAGRAADQADLPPLQAGRLHRTAAILDAELKERAGDLAGALAAWTVARDRAREEGHRTAELQARAGMGLVQVALGDGHDLTDELGTLWKRLAPGDPLWPRVTLALAEVRLSTGHRKGAARLWSQLSEMARDTHSAGLAARAELGRSLGVLAGGDLVAATAALADAEAALRASGDLRSLSRCLMVSAELSLAAGRLGAAEELALEAHRTHPRAALFTHALVALARDASGQPEACTRHAKEAQVLAAETGVRGAPALAARAAAARALLAAGRRDDAAELLLAVQPGSGTPAGLTDPTGQVLALRARVSHDPDQASADAWSALGRDLPAFPVAAARIALDAATGLTRAGDVAAEDAVLEALERTEVPGLELLRLDAARLARDLGLVASDEFDRLRNALAPAAGPSPGFVARWQ